MTIYGYPEAVFQPTNFHTATPIENSIYIIGCLGYPKTRDYANTPVYRLDLETLRIEQLNPTGPEPGWIFKHRTSPLGDTKIRLWGGQRAISGPDGEIHEPNTRDFVLNLEQLEWLAE